MTPTFDRRAFLLGASALTGLAACGPAIAVDMPAINTAANERRFASAAERKFTEPQWRQKLPGQAFEIMRHEDTEYPGTGPFLNEHRKGMFHCAGCDLPLFNPNGNSSPAPAGPASSTRSRKTSG
jgi:peptide-methionine (R)-S-oxide reductase